MADAVVSFAVERLGDLLISESKLLSGVTNQVNEVRDDLKRMQNFLKEAEKRQIQDERVRGWVNEIKELAFRTEDVIELFALQAGGSGFKEALRRSACITCHLISRHKVAMDINGIKAKLADIQQSLPTFGITGLEQGETSVPQRIFYSHDVEKDFVGMEKEIDQLVSDLKKKDEKHEVVSLWGMGGQGKTTLAQKLYNHVEIRDHFEAFAWVCISQQFDREKVLKGILTQLLPDGREGEVSNMEDTELVDGLRRVQLEKKCLIVIDDIWNVDSWRMLQPAFPLGETTSGCKILLTTRYLSVAEIGSVCKIPGLTEDEGWQLLSRKTRIYDQPELLVASEMERIGRNMVRRCKGLPLAISSLGGILKGKQLVREWEKINNDITFYLAKGKGVTEDNEYYTVKRVLGLSYDNLPSRLRHCFLCFANYKEDEIIDTEELYIIWMAEGLISVEDRAQGEMMLEVAERYLDELAHRSLVTIKTYRLANESWPKHKTCVVHDLIQDMCWSKVKEEGVMNVIDLESKLDIGSRAGIVRRLCVRSYNANRDVLEPYDRQVLAQIRSLFIWNGWKLDPPVWPNNIFTLEKFKLLRVFTAKNFKLSKENVRSLSELVYLKYLSLERCELDILPASIGKLRNLETLDVRTRGGALSIPNVLWKLKLLIHLYLPRDMSVGGGAKKLRSEGLNELELFYGFNSKYCEAHDLFQLPKLKAFTGYMTVEENLTTQTIIDFGNAKLRESHHVKIGIVDSETEVGLVVLLECSFMDSLYIRASVCVIPKVYDCTRFSRRLTELTLDGFIFEENPMILLGNLPNLRFLTLSLVKNTYLDGEIVCSSVSFPKLETLFFGEYKRLRKWRLEQGAMPNLTHLFIRKCLELEMLPEAAGAAPG
ncbi:probable disease resistance protein RF9 isoform X2 [Daucus carota subsp. sativus]|uniref:probable disease resistance protein RF9 isoform X2 n=1 Tax=Daucus carota subsp. sativus TaxID=79200 RepID=UPI003082F2C1